MKFSRLLLLGLFFSTGIINAQTDFRPGYIIKNSGDTLYGQIDYRGDQLMGSICNFKNADNTINKYLPNENELTAFRFIDGKYYVSREINSEKVFLEYLIKGEISIYYLRDNNGDHYYLDKEGVRLTEIPYEEGVTLVIDKSEIVGGTYDKRVFYESKKHIGLLKYYMQGAPELQSRINSFGKPEHKNLIKLAEDYHNSVCEGKQCIIYEKKQPALKVNLELVAGVVNFVNFDNDKTYMNSQNPDNPENLTNKYYFQSGVIAHFWMPRVNEKIYLKTGFLYSQAKGSDGESILKYVKIPIHIGYMVPNTFRIRPSFSIGLLSPSYSGGVAIKLNKRINLGVQSWVNFYQADGLFFIPSKLFNYSILGSLYIEL